MLNKTRPIFELIYCPDDLARRSEKKPEEYRYQNIQYIWTVWCKAVNTATLLGSSMWERIVTWLLVLFLLFFAFQLGRYYQVGYMKSNPELPSMQQIIKENCNA